VYSSLQQYCTTRGLRRTSLCLSSPWHALRLRHCAPAWVQTPTPTSRPAWPNRFWGTRQRDVQSITTTDEEQHILNLPLSSPHPLKGSHGVVLAPGPVSVAPRASRDSPWTLGNAGALRSGVARRSWATSPAQPLSPQPTLRAQNITLPPFVAADAPHLQRLAGAWAVARDCGRIPPTPHRDGTAKAWLAGNGTPLGRHTAGAAPRKGWSVGICSAHATARRTSARHSELTALSLAQPRRSRPSASQRRAHDLLPYVRRRMRQLRCPGPCAALSAGEQAPLPGSGGRHAVAAGGGHGRHGSCGQDVLRDRVHLPLPQRWRL